MDALEAGRNETKLKKKKKQRLSIITLLTAEHDSEDPQTAATGI